MDRNKFTRTENLPFLRDSSNHSLTVDEIESVVSSFECLLEQEAPESEIHKILAGNTYFFSGMMRMHGQSPLYSKIMLGNQHVTDFVYPDLTSFGPDWRLIEIEPPSVRLFKRNGEPTQEFNHAIYQVRTWYHWMNENTSYVQKYMPGMIYPRSYLFIGRRSELTSDRRTAMKRLSHDCRAFASIHTLDRLTDWARQSALTIGGKVSPNWTVPRRAYSHSDLMSGRPSAFFYWLDQSVRGRHPVLDLQHLRNEREVNYPGSELREISDPEFSGY